jgi:hypothetical protein
MPYTITWSPTARITYLNILEYVEDNWTHKEVNAFVNQTEKGFLNGDRRLRTGNFMRFTACSIRSATPDSGSDPAVH